MGQFGPEDKMGETMSIGKPEFFRKLSACEKLSVGEKLAGGSVEMVEVELDNPLKDSSASITVE